MENLNDNEIITLLQRLFTNMNNLDSIYYDMFINTNPMDVKLERYNQDGLLETYILPNRAKDRYNAIQGRGNPEGVYSAGIGALYFDILTNNIYIKISDSGATGWTLIKTSVNFLPGEDYLAPNGSASHLTDLSASSIDGGILDVRVGGTGNTGLEGILKGKGSNPIGVAKENVDYVTPQTYIGMLGFFPCDIESLPEGWLVCNGAFVNKTDYPRLAERLGDKYLYIGTEWDRTVDPEYNVNKIALPDYRGYYLRGWNNTNSTGNPIKIGDHEYGGIPNIKGVGGLSWYAGGLGYSGIGVTQITGPYNLATTSQCRGIIDSSTTNNDRVVEFNASRCSGLYKDNLNEIRVNGIYALICIYAGVKEESYSE